MIDKYQALKIAQEYLNKKEYTIEVLVDENSVIEKEKGWVISYQSKEYFLKRDDAPRLVGNWSIFVSKMDGSIEILSIVSMKKWESKI